MIVYAQLSDIHLDGEERADERARRVMTHLDTLPLDAILLTGDIADHGEPTEYEQAREVLKSSLPILTCPGNHDRRRPYREVLLRESLKDDQDDDRGDQGDDARGGRGGDLGGGPGRGANGVSEIGPVNRVHEVAGVVFAMCDSTVPGEDHGFLDEETLAWLDATLGERPGAPAFVCFHHPPVPLHIPYVDAIRQFGEDRLADVLARHPQVVAVLCGHAHTSAVTTFAGRPLLVAPGVVSTLRLPGEEGIVDLEAPPGYALHVLHDDRRLTTHYRTV
ncbi:metallophosphoesterase [Actinomadura terrae]|uniref:metallophosphoesterase n=1 Tax=Actinomadura terrae TaxID=604353 RepID=UPI001FA7969D|nr:metallophosphoesterase [Actinomadura terrae]